jgi:CxxC-x17-CxxC domain-containing protein
MGNFNRDDRSGPRRDFNRRGFGKRGFGGHGPGREMHKAVCGKCGKDCEVPFEPTDGRPVFCSECFEKKEGEMTTPRKFQDRDRDRGPRRPDFDRRDGPRPHGPELFEAINRKLDKILEILSTPSLVEEKEAETKSKAPKKKSPITKKII